MVFFLRTAFALRCFLLHGALALFLLCRALIVFGDARAMLSSVFLLTPGTSLSALTT
jgi:hypothetical protein